MRGLQISNTLIGSSTRFITYFKVLVSLIIIVTLCSCGGMRNRTAQKDVTTNQVDNSRNSSYRDYNYDNETQDPANEIDKYSSDSIADDLPDASLDMDNLRNDLDYIANKIKSNTDNTYINTSSFNKPDESITASRDKIHWKQTSGNNSNENNNQIDNNGTITANAAINDIEPVEHKSISGEINSTDNKPVIVNRNSNNRNSSVTTNYTLSEMMVMLSSQLAQERVYADNPLRYDLANAALLLIDPERRIDPDSLYDLDQSQKDIIAAYQNHFLNLYTNISTSFDPKSLAADLHKLAESLKPEPTLEITTFRLCKSVLNYGNFTEFESTSFLRGRSHQMIAYVEVENFKSILGANSLYHTVLAEEFELYTDADGTLVYSEPSQSAPDECRNIRRDFYLVRKITLPANLNVGQYQLKVRVVDGQSNAEAEAIIPIKIVASSALLGRDN